MKNVLIRIRNWAKFFVLISAATFIIAGIVAFVFKPIYSVTLNGELIGYCSKKSKLQAKIDEYIEKGNGDNSNLAFVQVDSMPQYKMCLLKRNVETNDDEIFQKVTGNGTAYYKYYAVLEDSEEKAYVADFATAESNRLFVNYSQDNLNHMDHIINESVEFRFLDRNHYVLDSFITPSMLVSGFGNLVLRNIKGQILITKWLGTVTVIDCPDVHIVANTSADICKLDYLLISRGSVVYLENQIHIIKKMKLTADSICRHWRANVNRLDYVGPGCTYWCSAQVSIPGRVQLNEYTESSNTVFDFNMSDIIGAFVSDFDNILIVSQKNLTPRLGNSDTEPEPSVYVSEFHMKY